MTTITKNPKNVERGKKAYETHMRKTKEKILAGTPADTPASTPASTVDTLASTPSSTVDTPASTPSSTADTHFSTVLIAIGAVVAGYYVWQGSAKSSMPPAEPVKKIYMDLS